MAGVWCKIGFRLVLVELRELGTWWRRSGGCVHKGN
jgi:hypothetical protein